MAHQSGEEIWNPKQLAKAVGLACASAALSRSPPPTADALEASLTVAEGLRQRHLTLGLASWLGRFHAADFAVDAAGAVTLTANGAKKFTAKDTIVAPADLAPAPPVDAALAATRDAVFSELCAAASAKKN